MARHKSQIWQTELNDLMRGIAGAFLFGAPFLYTMEVWWKGNFTSPPRMMLILGLAYLALILLNLRGGFRATREPRTPVRMMMDSFEGLAIALITSAFGLVLIGNIQFGTGIDAIMGRVITLALPFSIGVGIANNVLLRSEDKSWRGTLADAGGTTLGAIIVGAAISPTDEIPLISSGLSPGRLIVIILCSLVVSYIIVFQANFGSQRQRRSQPGFFQSPLSETLFSYIVSLGISLLMLWLFQVIRVGDPINQWVSYIIVMGLPSTIGGAAGRLAV
jgi:putative integral membrane protein (TIGR02587 family)